MAEASRRPLRLLAVLLSLWLGGCTALLPQPETAPQRFDLGPLPDQSVTDPGLAGIRLHSLRTSSWLSAEQIPYRLMQQRPEARHHYAAHFWIAAPSEMLRVRLEHLLATDGEVTERWRLAVELLSFEQVFTSAVDANATIMLRATLRQRGGNDRIQQRTFSATLPVAADVHGAIEGLPKVADTALTELLAWAAEVTTSLPPPCPPAVHRESC